MKSKRLIIYLGPLEGFEEVKRLVEPYFVVGYSEPSPTELADKLKTCHALIDASMRVHVSNAMITDAHNLEIISTATTGSDHIQREEVSRRGIILRTLKEDADLLLNLTPAAELSWALLMALARRLVPAVNHVLDGKWNREEFPGLMLRGRRIGIIGCGRIGQWIATYAKAFGMEVYGNDPFVDPWPGGIVKASMKEISQLSDFITIHVHLTKDTNKLIGNTFLANVKSGVILINTSRGDVVDEIDLLQKLESGDIGGYGADVISGEPNISNHPLIEYSRSHENVIITPHCGGYSPDAVRLVCVRAAEKVINHFSVVNE